MAVTAVTGLVATGAMGTALTRPEQLPLATTQPIFISTAEAAALPPATSTALALELPSAAATLALQQAQEQQRASRAKARTTPVVERATASPSPSTSLTVAAAKASASTSAKEPTSSPTTRKKATPTQTPTTTVTKSAPSSGFTGGSTIPASVKALDWDAMAQCEATGNPKAYNPAGPYYGLYQFDLSTWRSVGGSGLPTQASAAEQTYRAQLLYLERGGASAWPVCGKQL